MIHIKKGFIILLKYSFLMAISFRKFCYVITLAVLLYVAVEVLSPPEWHGQVHNSTTALHRLDTYISLVTTNGTINNTYGEKVKNTYGGTVNTPTRGTVKHTYGGTVNTPTRGTVISTHGGTVNISTGGTGNNTYKGTIRNTYRGKVIKTYGATVNKTTSGTVNKLNDATVINTTSAAVNSGNTKDNMIPKIIHQIWSDEIIPTEFVENVKGLVADNNAPDWQYYFWTLNSSRAFIRDKFPTFLQTWDNYPDTLSRVDSIRYLILYEYGGVYLDLDTVSVKPLDPFIRQHTCVFTPEPEEHYIIKYNVDLQLANSPMLCRSRHPFFRTLIDILPSLLINGCKTAYRCTGPIVLTRVQQLYETSHPNETTIVSSEIFHDVYDLKYISQTVHQVCNNLELLYNKPRHLQTCRKWIARGRDNRTLSSKAYAYHTWFHVNNKFKNSKNVFKWNVSFKPENHIALIVPHVKMYRS